MTIYTNASLRALALRTQQLHLAGGAEPPPDRARDGRTHPLDGEVGIETALEHHEGPRQPVDAPGTTARPW